MIFVKYLYFRHCITRRLVRGKVFYNILVSWEELLCLREFWFSKGQIQMQDDQEHVI